MVRRDVTEEPTSQEEGSFVASCASLAGKSPVPESVGGVNSPLLSNIFLHALDVLWTRKSAPLHPEKTRKVELSALRFNQLDSYVWRRLRSLRVKRKGRNLRAGELENWTREYFWNLGLHRLRGTVQYSEQPFWKEAA